MALIRSKKIDPKLAQDIEEEMDEIDAAGKPRASGKKSKPCPDCSESLIGSGLIDALTLCSRCKGTGQILL